MKNTCVYCQKAVIYPEGVYLKNGKEAHIICLQKAREKAFKIIKNLIK